MDLGRLNPFRESPEKFVSRAIKLQKAWQNMLTPMVFVEDGKAKIIYGQSFSGYEANREAERVGSAMYRNDERARSFAAEHLGVAVGNALELAPHAQLSERQEADLAAIKEFRERQDSQRQTKNIRLER